MSVLAAPGWEKCRFCNQHARYACDTPAHVRREVDARDIRHGDWVFSPQSNRLCQVVDIQADSPAGHVLLITVEYRHGRKRPPYPQFTYKRKAHAGVHFYKWAGEPKSHSLAAIRPGPCATAVCEEHVRELAEHKHLCQDHWRAWEAIA